MNVANLWHARRLRAARRRRALLGAAIVLALANAVVLGAAVSIGDYGIVVIAEAIEPGAAEAMSTSAARQVLEQIEESSRRIEQRRQEVLHAR